MSKSCFFQFRMNEDEKKLVGKTIRTKDKDGKTTLLDKKAMRQMQENARRTERQAIKLDFEDSLEDQRIENTELNLANNLEQINRTRSPERQPKSPEMSKDETVSEMSESKPLGKQEERPQNQVMAVTGNIFKTNNSQDVNNSDKAANHRYPSNINMPKTNKLSNDSIKIDGKPLDQGIDHDVKHEEVHLNNGLTNNTTVDGEMGRNGTSNDVPSNDASTNSKSVNGEQISDHSLNNYNKLEEEKRVIVRNSQDSCESVYLGKMEKNKKDFESHMIGMGDISSQERAASPTSDPFQQGVSVHEDTMKISEPDKTGDNVDASQTTESEAHQNIQENENTLTHKSDAISNSMSGLADTRSDINQNKTQDRASSESLNNKNQIHLTETDKKLASLDTDLSEKHVTFDESNLTEKIISPESYQESSHIGMTSDGKTSHSSSIEMINKQKSKKEEIIKEIVNKEKTSDNKNQFLASGLLPSSVDPSKKILPIVDDTVDVDKLPKDNFCNDETELDPECELIQMRRKGIVELEGMIWKRRFFCSCLWHQRHFTLLKDGTLKYFRNKNQPPKSSINILALRDIRRLDELNKSHSFRIILKQLDGEDILAFNDEESRNLWASKMFDVKRKTH